LPTTAKEKGIGLNKFKCILDGTWFQYYTYIFCCLSFCRFIASSLQRRSINCAERGLGSFCFCFVCISFISTFDIVTRSFFYFRDIALIMQDNIFIE
jgi:hypothetical protein